MSILDQFLSLLAPHECLGCGAEGSIICANCASNLDPVPERCYRCRKLSPYCLTCTACRKQSRLKRVSVATIYDGVAKELVWKLKFSGAQSAAKSLAIIMNQQIETNQELLIVPVPTATSRVRQRGYDQATLIARELSKLSGLKYARCLARVNQTHQVGSGRSKRIKQLTNAFRITNPHTIKDAHILLIDDVITTGATLESATKTLRLAGAKRIDALVFAQP